MHPLEGGVGIGLPLSVTSITL